MDMDFHSFVSATERSKEFISTLQNTFEGYNCILLGNGPSLAESNLNRLNTKDTFVFGTNRIFLGLEKWNLNLDFYMAINLYIVEQSFEEMLKIDAMRLLANSCFPYVPPEDFTFVNTGVEDWTEFSRDPTVGICEGCTVTYAALQMTHWMGFETVYLLGIDHDYPDVAGKVPHEEIIQHGEDRDHFTTDYFPEGFVWQAPDLVGSERYYTIAREEYEKDGREIINCTPGSKLEVFKRGKLGSLLL